MGRSVSCEILARDEYPRPETKRVESGFMNETANETDTVMAGLAAPRAMPKSNTYVC